MTLHQIRARIRALLARRRHERDLDDEIRFHLEEEAEARREAGLSVDEARRAARRDFGNVTAIREATHDAWGWTWLESAVQDVRYGCRALVRTPIVTAVAVLSLALGIGATTAIFTVLDTLLLRPLPVESPHHLVQVVTPSAGSGEQRAWTNPIWEEVRQREHLFAGAFASSSTRFNLAERGERQFVDGIWASGAFFEVLGVRPVIGRLFSVQDDRPGGGPDGPVAVISYSFWQSRYAGAAAAIGQTITLEQVPFTIIGVTPPEFFGVDVGRTFDIAAPIGASTHVRGPKSLQYRSSWWLRVMLRLKPDQSVEAATAALRAVQPQIRTAAMPLDWNQNDRDHFLARPFLLRSAAAGDSNLRPRYERPMVTLMAIAALVLLIACANLSNLLLARATARRHEMSLRGALGASRLRLARQLLTESLVLAAAGAALGLGVAHVGSELLVNQLSTSTFRVYLPLGIEWRVLGFTALVTVATAVLFGTAPALRSLRVEPSGALRSHGRGSSHEPAFGLGQMLVVAQVALSMVLLVGAVLLMRTFSTLSSRDPGFDTDAIAIANVALPASSQPSARAQTLQRLLDAAGAVPGVTSVVMSEVTPVSNNHWNDRVDVLDSPVPPPSDRLSYFNRVTSGWFRTYGTPMIAGRDFARTDTPTSPLVAIANEAFAERFTGGRNPIGMHVRVPATPVTPAIDREIVGYVRNATYESLRQDAPPTLYVPFSQLAEWPRAAAISVRVDGMSPASVLKPLAAALTDAHGDSQLSLRLLGEQIDASLTQERVTAGLAGFFGALGLLLAGLGLYAVTSYSVTRRRAEIGIRMALGAKAAAVELGVLRSVLQLIAVGAVVGGAVSIWLSDYVAPLLFRVEPQDPSSLIVSLLVLGATGALAGWIPARRAARIDPAKVLREA
jgi:putative ABC transport system permease protein